MGKLDGKVAVITGASSGIGKATAIRFAKEGASIAICARREEMLLKTVKLCEEAGAKTLGVVCDLSDLNQMKEFSDKIKETFGKVDILINNAFSSTQFKPFEETTLDELEASLKSQLYPTWFMMQACFPMMKENGGSIINMISHSAQGEIGMAAYGTPKGAIGSLTRIAAIDWGKYNIRVNNVAPIAISKELEATAPKEIMDKMIVEVSAGSPLNRPGYVEADIVPVMLFLASDDSQWITGQDIHAEGGLDIHW